MSKIVGVIPQNDSAILIEFEYGNKILFKMERLIKTIPYQRLLDTEFFRTVKYDEKAIYWEDREGEKTTLFPLRLSVDTILFTLRD